MSVPRLVITPGEPAGIGPELVVQLAASARQCEMIAVADPMLLEAAAQRLDIPLSLIPFEPQAPPAERLANSLRIIPCELAQPAKPGCLNPANASYVLQTLNLACRLCLDGVANALVTGPVHKGVINEAGIAFSGHTEFLSTLCGGAQPVMMLMGDKLKVILLTTHLPLSQVPKAITARHLKSVLRISHAALKSDFGLDAPRITVLGLNPHAGEGGHMGSEEIDIIAPVMEELRGEGMNLTGPVSADTAFTPERLPRTDAFVAMYHDQGLPVLKSLSFGSAVNVTLGLPIVRTSVDHGTGLDIAGRGVANLGSFEVALDLALRIAQNRQAA